MIGRHQMHSLLRVAVLLYLHKSGSAVNVAAGKDTTSSSEKYSSRSSARAVDGDNQTYFHSMDGQNQWLAIDLGKFYNISSVKVYNFHQYRGRLQKATILLSSNSTHGNLSLGEHTQWMNVAYQGPLMGSDGNPPNKFFSYKPAVNESILYVRYVAVYTTNSLGLIISEVEVEAFMPDNANVEAFPLNQTCVSLNWTAPANPHVTITGYKYRCAVSDFVNTVDYTNTTDEAAMSCGHPSGANITCQAAASSADGFGPPGCATTRVNCSEPSELQLNISHSVSAEQNVTITLSWQASPNCDRISSYFINVQTDGSTMYNESLFTNTVNYSVKPYTSYTANLRAVNNEGLEQQMNTTWLSPETKPSDGPAVSLGFNTSCVTINVSDPTTPNGNITHYLIQCQGQSLNQSRLLSQNVTSNELLTSLCGFPSASMVSCNASAANSAGESPARHAKGYTDIKVTTSSDNFTTIKDTQSSEQTVSIILKQISLENGNVGSYRLVVREESKALVKRSVDALVKRSVDYLMKRSVDSPMSGSCDLTRTFNFYNATSFNQTCYIAAEIAGENVTDDGFPFTLGDNTTVGGYYNALLKPQTNYTLHVDLMVPVNGKFTLSKFLSPISFMTSKKATEPSPTASPPKLSTASPPTKLSTGIAVGVVVTLLTAGAVFGVLLYFRKRIKQKYGKEDSPILLDPLDPILPSPSVSNPIEGVIPEPSCEVHADNDGEHYYEEVPLEGVACDPIPIASLSRFAENNKERILLQYLKLEKIPEPPMTEARLAINKGKCKYVNLYPADDYRVKLQREGTDDLDFINASYLKGYDRNNAFIAAQAPLNATVKDFWLMIWQEHIKSIVMVTNLLEKGKDKCVKYWPDDVGSVMDFDDISVTLVTDDNCADFAVRTMKAKKGEKTMMIKQFQYKSWPDHGVPVEMSPFVIYVRKIKEHTIHETTPILVHCSAGVGRTGTFIALDILVNQAKEKQIVHPYDCVAEMRLRRPCMVQTEDQYLFLHHALDEVLSTEEFVCSPGLLEARLMAHRNPLPTDIDFIQAEYDRMEAELLSLRVSYSMGEAEENRCKNRYSDILPDMNHCVYSGGGGYINAILVDDYKQSRQIIATQLPLSSTVADFWRLIEAQEVKVIVQLQQQDQLFYPASDEESTEVENFVITRRTNETKDGVTNIVLTITSKSNVIKVSLLLISDWLSGQENQTCFPSSTSMLDYLKMLQKLQQQSGDRKICITDLDGSTRCGLFISAYNAIESLKVEQEASMYNTVLKVRYRRKQFVSTIESYVYLYTLLNDFSEAFLDYANFKTITNG